MSSGRKAARDIGRDWCWEGIRESVTTRSGREVGRGHHGSSGKTNHLSRPVKVSVGQSVDGLDHKERAPEGQFARIGTVGGSVLCKGSIMDRVLGVR